MAGGLVTGLGTVVVSGVGDLAGGWVLVDDTSAPASVVGMVTLRFDGPGALPVS
jgi:hypothetical protein